MAKEYNVIQRPELLRRLQKHLGIRQQHIAPGLNEGVQAVVVVDDLSQHTQGEPLRRSVRGYAQQESDAGFPVFLIWSPLANNMVARLHKCYIQHIAGSAAAMEMRIGLNNNETAAAAATRSPQQVCLDYYAASERPTRDATPRTELRFYKDLGVPPFNILEQRAVDLPAAPEFFRPIEFELEGIVLFPGAWCGISPIVELGDDSWRVMFDWTEEPRA